MKENKYEMTEEEYNLLLDCSWDDLNRLAMKVKLMFPDITESQEYFHRSLLSYLVLKMVEDGWTLKELLEQVTDEVDAVKTFLDEGY